LECFNKLFFFGALEVKLTWKDKDPGSSSLGWYNNGVIAIDSIYCGNISIDDCEGRKVRRLHTILHEAMHAFLDQLGCHDCPSFQVNVRNAGGHGRAWQILRIHLADATDKLLKVRLDVGGFRDFLLGWKKVRYLPSLHDLEVWEVVRQI
jgi:predicted nucleic acid-binding Zn finger protein